MHRSGALPALQAHGRARRPLRICPTAWRTCCLMHAADSLSSLGGCMKVDDAGLWSPNHRYHLVVQGDGNIVLYNGLQSIIQNAIWSTKTTGSGSANVLCMQGDGNLVVYTRSGVAKWSSKTVRGSALGPYTLRLQDDGNLVIYSSTNAIWATNTAASSPPPPSPPPVRNGHKGQSPLHPLLCTSNHDRLRSARRGGLRRSPWPPPLLWPASLSVRAGCMSECLHDCASPPERRWLDRRLMLMLRSCIQLATACRTGFAPPACLPSLRLGLCGSTAAGRHRPQV